MSNFSKFLVQPRLTSSAVKAALLTVCVVLCAAALWHRPVTASSEPAIQFKFTAINFPDAFWTVAYAINDHGEIVGQYFDASNGARSRGFVKTEKGFSRLDFPGGDTVATTLLGVNSEGNIVGLHSVSSGPPLAPVQGFIHDGAHFTDIRVPGDAGYTVINGINDSDELVGVTSDTGGFGGFLYSRNGFSHISFPGTLFVNTAPSAINNSGTIVGTIDCDGGGCESGFLYKDGKYIKIVMPGAYTMFTSLGGVNNRGDLGGSWTDTNSAQHGFVEVEGHFTSIDFPGASANGNTAVLGINDHDEIVGLYNGGDCTGARSMCGFVAKPVKAD